MTVEELKQSIKSKKFVDHTNFPYTFIPENTLRCGICINHVVRYCLYENNDQLCFTHSNALGAHDRRIEIMQENPLILRLTDTIDASRFVVWTEVR